MKLGLRTGDIRGAAGSSYVELCDTKVFAAVYGPIEPDNEGSVQCVVDYVWDDTDQLAGLQHKLGHTFASSICTKSYEKTLIRIAISVVDRGSMLVDAAVLAGTMALIDAGIEMSDFIVSCTAGLVDGVFVPFGKSDTQVRVAALPSKDEIIETDVIGSVGSDVMMSAVDVAMSGCRELIQALRRFLSSKLVC